MKNKKIKELYIAGILSLIVAFIFYGCNVCEFGLLVYSNEILGFELNQFQFLTSFALFITTSYFFIHFLDTGISFFAKIKKIKNKVVKNNGKNKK